MQTQSKHRSYKSVLLIAYFLVVLGTGLIAYARLFQIASNNRLFYFSVGENRYAAIFVAFYAAGRLAQQACIDHGVQIYSGDLQKQQIHELLAHRPVSSYDRIYYPPFDFLFFGLISEAPLQVAWTGVVAVSLLLNIAGLRLLLPSIKWPSFLAAAVLLICNFATWYSVRHGGGVTLFVMPVHACFWASARIGSRAAGLLSGLTAIKPQYLPQTLIACAVGSTKRLSSSFLACLSMVLLVVLSISLFGLKNVLAFPETLFSVEQTGIGGVQAESMQNVRGLLLSIPGVDSSIALAASTILALASLVALGTLWWYYRKGSLPPQSFNCCAAVTILSSLMFSVHTHLGDYSLAAIPCTMLWNHEGSMSRRCTVWTRAIILSFPLLSWLPYFWQLHGVLVGKLFFWWALTMIALASYQLRHSFRKNCRTAQST